ncbi:cutinase family protein, partial [Nocardia abscessus]|uniref:cutinase family protein n=1 Tax=Nocardia abscessus TaxID=120957 RepID=UPI0024559ABE
MAVIVSFTIAISTAHAEPTGVPLGETCPVLYAFGVQGSEEASPEAGLSSDSGALGQLFGPLAVTAGDLVQRAYVPYGRAPDGTALPYEAAITAAAERLEQMAVEVVARCPNTKIAAAGYAHGAPAVSRFAERVGTGGARVSADHIAAIALLANPNRATNTPVGAGRPGRPRPPRPPGAPPPPRPHPPPAGRGGGGGGGAGRAAPPPPG